MVIQEMSDIEQEHLQTLIHQIATHIVEGSAAVQELKSTIARLKNERSNIEYAVYENWLKASKTIQAAGKDKSSWERFIKSLKIVYEGEDETSLGCRAPNKEDNLENASKELWAHELRNNIVVGEEKFVEIAHHDHHIKQEAEKLDLNEVSLYDVKPMAHDAMTIGEPNYKSTGKRKLEDSSELNERIAYDTKRLAQGHAKTISEVNCESKDKKKLKGLGDVSGRIVYDTKKLAEAAMKIGEPNDKSKGKRKLKNKGEGGKKNPPIQFTNGRKLCTEQMIALKKGGRCFFCEQKGHRAIECKKNIDNQRKS